MKCGTSIQIHYEVVIAPLETPSCGLGCTRTLYTKLCDSPWWEFIGRQPSSGAGVCWVPRQICTSYIILMLKSFLWYISFFHLVVLIFLVWPENCMIPVTEKLFVVELWEYLWLNFGLTWWNFILSPNLEMDALPHTELFHKPILYG